MDNAPDTTGREDRYAAASGMSEPANADATGERESQDFEGAGGSTAEPEWIGSMDLPGMGFEI